MFAYFVEGLFSKSVFFCSVSHQSSDVVFKGKREEIEIRLSRTRRSERKREKHPLDDSLVLSLLTFVGFLSFAFSSAVDPSAQVFLAIEKSELIRSERQILVLLFPSFLSLSFDTHRHLFVREGKDHRVISPSIIWNIQISWPRQLK